MNSRILTCALAILGLGFGFHTLMSCAPQTDSNSKEVVTGKTEPVGTNGGEVAIDGADVSIPAGALAVGSEVSVRNGDVPAEFGIENVTGLSKALEVSAVGPDGQPLSEANEPLTINIDYGEGSSLNLTNSEADLCVLAKATSGLFVWRRAALTVGGTNVSFKSKYFGTFQVVFCGTKALEGFSEVNRSITGEAAVNMTMVIPANSPNFSHGKNCVMILSSESEEDKDSSSENGANDEGSGLVVIGMTESDATITKDQTVIVEVGPSDVVEGKDHYVVATFLSKSASCPFKLGDTITSETTFSLLAMLAFKVDNAELRAGLSGTLHANGVFKTSEMEIEVENSAGLDLTEPKGCLDVDVKDGGKSLFFLPLGTTGFTGGTKKVYQAIGNSTGTEKEVRYFVGRDCTSFDDKFTPDPATGKPYIANFHTQDIVAGQTLKLAPLKVRTMLPFHSGCIEVLRGGTLAINGDYRDNRLMQSIVTLGSVTLAPAQKDYSFIVPKLATATSTYDYQIRPLEEGQTCDDAVTATSDQTATDESFKDLINIPTNLCDAPTASCP